jgi:ABC-type branched-subunit amino acid transport system substrate-binding protein
MPELLERGGKFVTCSVYVDGFFADSERPGTKKFVNLWRRNNKDRDPGLLEATGYDAGGIIRKVVDQKKPTTRAAFRENLADVKDFDGATGKTSFDDRREGVKQLFLMTIDAKGVREIDPNAKVTGS